MIYPFEANAMTPPEQTKTREAQTKPLTLEQIASQMRGGRGPDCIWCNAPTQKTGTCFTCVACGETTGCG